MAFLYVVIVIGCLDTGVCLLIVLCIIHLLIVEFTGGCAV